MNNKCFIRLAITVLMSLTLLSPLSFADDHTKEVLSETWSMTPKEGMAGDMQDGMTKHGKFRDTLKETREWRMYTPVLGNRLDTLAVRSFGFGWEDLDKFREWSAKNDSQKNFNENVDPYVHSYGHYLAIVDTKNSNWGPQVEYNFVGVTSYMVKIGHRQMMEADKKILSDAAKSKDWAMNFMWEESVSGHDLMQLAVPYKNWADMAPPETAFAEMLAKHLGSEAQAKEVLERWSTHFSSISYDIWALRDDLN
jgi:hypothetical protein